MLCTVSTIYSVVLFALTHYQVIFAPLLTILTNARMFVTQFTIFLFLNQQLRIRTNSCSLILYAIQSIQPLSYKETRLNEISHPENPSNTYMQYFIHHLCAVWCTMYDGFSLHCMHKPHTFSMMNAPHRHTHTFIKCSQRINCQLCNFISNYLRSISL